MVRPEPGAPRADFDDDTPIRLTRRLQASERIDASLSLPFDQRQRRRVRARLDNGQMAGVLLDGGPPLRDGDLLGGERGYVARVRAAPERVSSASSQDPRQLARAAYHLGNRHVALAIASDSLRWPHDPVLDAMVRGLGLDVAVLDAPFEPEPGAYASAAHRHGPEPDHPRHDR